MRPGIILGLANATQKNTITTIPHRIAISSGLVKANDPIVNSGLKSKSCRPGAGYPHPLKMWQPPRGGRGGRDVTGHRQISSRGFPSGGARGGPLLRACSYSPSLAAVPVDDPAERYRDPDQHADREEQLMCVKWPMTQPMPP